MRRVVALSLVVAAVSLLLVAPAPSYDPWAWLLWGDQVLGGDLNTLEGPSFKPLPVAVCTLLAPLGTIAPWLWVLLARAGAALAVVLAFRIGRRLADGSAAAGALAALGVVLCESYLGLAAAGWSEGILLALVLGAAEAWRAGRPRWALAWGVAAGLVRVETWPFLLVAGLLAWRRRPQDRPFLVAAILLVPAAWILPELVGSGQALRSAARARIPNPGQPALSDNPMLASLRAALALPLWPLWAGVALTSWRAWFRHDRAARALLVPAAVGLAWIGLVAVMSAAGFSGEPRYALPGAALVALSGASGLVMAARHMVPASGPTVSGPVSGPASGAVVADGAPEPRSEPLAAAGRVVPGSGAIAEGRACRRAQLATATVVLLVVGTVVPRLGELVELRSAQAYQWELQADLATAAAGVGGPGAVLACGQLYVGALRGPLLAHHLGVAKHRVEPDEAPAAPGVVFRSALHPGDPPAPAAPDGFREVARAGAWQVLADCDGGPADRLE